MFCRLLAVALDLFAPVLCAVLDKRKSRMGDLEKETEIGVGVGG